MIKFKAFDVNEYDYEEQMEQFQAEFPQAEFLQITGEHMSPERIWFKYEPSDTSATTDKLSVEKLQEQLNTAKKALREIAEIIDDHIHECNYGCDNHCELNGSLNIYSVEDLKSVTESALAVIGGDDEL